MQNKIILIVEDNPKLASLFEQALASDFQIAIACSLKDARSCDFIPDGMLLDMQLPDGEGIELIEEFRRKNPTCAIVVATAHGTIPKAVEAVRLGALDFLEKPVDLDALLERFKSYLQADWNGEVIAISEKMKATLEQASKVAAFPFCVLLTGETGTGKEVLARFIHAHSGRKDFIAFNCANLTAELADSMLFGHLKGSFTGASEAKEGLVKAADNGTLFLDEVGELPIGLQPKLLRFLDTGHYLPIGATQEQVSRARVIVATNRDLKAEIKAGRFREDLFFRISTVPIHIPALRERREDILALAKKHLKELTPVLGYTSKLSNEALELLFAYDFPGNVRELFHLLDRAAVLGQREITINVIEPFLDIQKGFTASDDAEQKDEESSSNDAGLLEKSQRQASEMEKELITSTLQDVRGNKAEAARRLKISYKTLLNKLKRFGMM